MCVILCLREQGSSILKSKIKYNVNSVDWIKGDDEIHEHLKWLPRYPLLRGKVTVNIQNHWKIYYHHHRQRIHQIRTDMMHASFEGIPIVYIDNLDPLTEWKLDSFKHNIWDNGRAYLCARFCQDRVNRVILNRQQYMNWVLPMYTTRYGVKQPSYQLIPLTLRELTLQQCLNQAARQKIEDGGRALNTLLDDIDRANLDDIQFRMDLLPHHCDDDLLNDNIEFRTANTYIGTARELLEKTHNTTTDTLPLFEVACLCHIYWPTIDETNNMEIEWHLNNYHIGRFTVDEVGFPIKSHHKRVEGHFLRHADTYHALPLKTKPCDLKCPYAGKRKHNNFENKHN